MKRKALIMALLFAVVKMEAMADMPRPTYLYHALPYPEWLASKAGMPNGIVLGVLIALGFIILHYIRVRRKSDITFLLFMRKYWASNLTICLLCLLGCLVRYEVVPEVQEVMAMMGGRVDVSVKPGPNESYFQYRERTRRLDNDLCLKCGMKLEHWHDMGSHTGCPKCDDLYRTCKECGKEFNYFFRNAHAVAMRVNGESIAEDPSELCDACIENLDTRKNFRHIEE